MVTVGDVMCVLDCAACSPGVVLGLFLLLASFDFYVRIRGFLFFQETYAPI